MKYKLWAIIFHLVWNDCLNYDKFQDLKGRIQIFIMVISYFNLCYGYIKEITYKKLQMLLKSYAQIFHVMGKKSQN